MQRRRIGHLTKEDWHLLNKDWAPNEQGLGIGIYPGRKGHLTKEDQAGFGSVCSTDLGSIKNGLRRWSKSIQKMEQVHCLIANTWIHLFFN